jgi:energy-coupling factor transporter ATP-binding protein EcfA2
MVKIVAMADLHLSDHKALGIDDTGRSIFLRKVVTLAELINKQAMDFNANAIVIAGDFYDSSILTPSVADAADEIVRALSKNIPLILTAGQHDFGTKTPELFPYHTHLSRFRTYSNVVFADKFTSINVNVEGRYKVCIAPWNPEHSLPDTAEGDIFVGHGAVQGCTNLEGYKFNSGFSQSELFKMFRLSIIGDIHNGQVFSSYDRKILIPGPPVQFNFKDSPVTGVWLCSVPKVGEVTCEFVSSESIMSNVFPKYLFTDDLEKKSSNLCHYRYKPLSGTKPVKGKAPEFRKDTSSIIDIGLSVIKRSKIDNQDLVCNIFSKLMESLPSTDRKVPRSRLHNIEIHNFLSIEDFVLDFKEFPDNLIITGKNGSGKSSLVEAIYWCLTGSTTKGISVNDVRNWYVEMGTFVSVVLEVEDTLYKIGRGRTDSPLLQIFMFTDKWTPYTGSKTADTQSIIYELLGISDREIKLLSYFPASNPSLFGSIGKSDRYSLLSTIVGMSTVDTARDKLAESVRTTGIETVSIESRTGTLRGVRDNAKIKLGEYLAKRDSQVTSDTKDLEHEKAEIEASLKTFVPGDKLREKIGLCCVKSGSIIGDKADLDAKITSFRNVTEGIKRDISNRKQSLVASLEGRCPTCGQVLSNDDVASSLIIEIENLRSRLPDARLEQSLVAALNEKDVEYEANEQALGLLRTDLEHVRGLETRLQLVSSSLAKAKEGLIDFGPLIQAETESYEKYKAEVTQDEARLSSLMHLQDAQNWIQKTLLRRNGLLISELAKQGQKLLQDQIDYLTEDESFKVMVEDDLSVSASFLSRQSADYNQLSTGQARVVDIILMCSLNNLFTQIYGLEYGILGLVIFDEVLSFLDPNYVDYCYGVVNRINVQKRIVISHDTSLISKFNSEISVVLEGKSSSTYIKNWGCK